jgi:hypothetical protein
MAASEKTTIDVTWTGQGRVGTWALSTAEVLTGILQRFEGVQDIRVLPKDERHGIGARDKVFVILNTHDVKRDFQIVNVLAQIDDVDMDLVPKAAIELVPDAAVSVIH